MRCKLCFALVQWAKLRADHCIQTPFKMGCKFRQQIAHSHTDMWVLCTCGFSVTHAVKSGNDNWVTAKRVLEMAARWGLAGRVGGRQWRPAAAPKSVGRSVADRACVRCESTQAINTSAQ